MRELLKDLQSAGNAGEFYTPRALTEFYCDDARPRKFGRNHLATSPVEREASSPRHLKYMGRNIGSAADGEKLRKCRCRSGMETVALPF